MAQNNTRVLGPQSDQGDPAEATLGSVSTLLGSISFWLYIRLSDIWSGLQFYLHNVPREGTPGGLLYLVYTFHFIVVCRWDICMSLGGFYVSPTLSVLPSMTYYSLNSPPTCCLAFKAFHTVLSYCLLMRHEVVRRMPRFLDRVPTEKF
jgi:hypothetical protein